ncbi:YchJ family metal-binding protein [Herbiconiux moechotypicola]|uniref:UPF0225 protein GCM10009851_32710 n=1 Tax=Herbiconiux moechotypicola TaxID=637393 RepID=A0ABN3DZD8_9MICO|nr:YchJ family metal-binding protein [Herbiconiux moechotypicola]MCS5731198.1 YchJ family metal-binding protein [Herbiconiux moechotypicola]
MSDRCPCLSGDTFGQCCEPYLAGRAHPPTAERLMRSRYTAFARGDATYLLASWHPSTRPASLELDPGIRWLSLEIVGRSGGGLLDTEGEVEFTARYRVTEADGTGRRGTQHERSRFGRDGGRWSYVGEA